MGKYDQMLAFGYKLFLEWNQEDIIHRHRLEHDPSYLYISFLGDSYRICRTSGHTENRITLLPAKPTVTLTLFDYLCRSNYQPSLSGRLLPVNSLKHVAQSSPDTVLLHRPHARKLQNHIPALKQALTDLQFDPFPQGDAACRFEVFDGFSVVFQFWEGDEEFEPSIRFLWDENSLYYLKYETAYYVMDCFLEKLHSHIAEIEKNVK